MAHYRVAKRYAKGFMDFLSEAKGDEKNAMLEMKQLNELVKSNQDFSNFIKSPVLDAKKKTSILNTVLANFSQETKTFLALIIKQGRSEAIPSIAQAFVSLYKNKHGIRTAIVTSAHPLEASQIEAIVAKAKEGLPEGTQVEVTNKIDPSLIGGFILRLDDKQFDASLSTKLNNIKKEFDSNYYIPKI